MGFLYTYRKAKEAWKRPKVRVFFGLWKNDPNLPVYRGGCIRLAKYGQYYNISKSTLLEDKSKTTYDSQGRPIKYMYHSEHNRIKQDVAWNRNIRRKLRRFGLGWLPPIIETPWWIKINVYNWDLMWKWKYDDVRYEFPPQFTIVFFGLCLTITLHEPTGGYYTSDDQYWEGILDWLYKYDKNMYKTVKFGGIWNRGKESFFSVRPEHLKRLEDYQEYCRAVTDYKAENPDSKAF